MTMVRHPRIDEESIEGRWFAHALIGPDLDLDVEGIRQGNLRDEETPTNEEAFIRTDRGFPGTGGIDGDIGSRRVVLCHG